MKILDFTPEHEKYDNLTILMRTPDLSRPFLRETWNMRLYTFLSHSLEHIISTYNDFNSKDLKTLISLSNKLNINFGQVPEWVNECIEKNNKYCRDNNICQEAFETTHLLNAELFSLPYWQSFGSRTYKQKLDEHLGIKRVYQLISTDRNKIKEIPIYGKKIMDDLIYFERKTFLKDISLNIKS